MENSVPAIIDIHTWAKVQARHVDNKPTAPRRKSKRLYELTGKIFCEKCGSHYFGTHKNDKRNPDWSASYYVCSTKKAQRTCDAKNIRKDKLDKFVIDSIKKYILDEKAVEEIAEHILKICGDTPNDVEAKIKQLEKRKSELVRMESDLTMKELKGEISKETFLILNKDFNRELNEISLELLQLESVSENAITKENIYQYLNDVLLNIDSPDGDILKNIFDKVVDKIIVSDDEVILYLVVSPLASAATLDKVSSGQPHYKVSDSIKIKELKNI